MMVLETPRLVLRTLTPRDAPRLLDFDTRNRGWLEPWEPARDQAYFTEERVLSSIRADARSVRRGTGCRWHLFLKDRPALVGSVALSNVVTGVFLSAHLGYRLDHQATGQGYMTEALAAVVRFAFDQRRLHRLEANVMPRNAPSRRLLTSLGFEEEGLARRYLKIAGVWEDHVHYVLLNGAVE